MTTTATTITLGIATVTTLPKRAAALTSTVATTAIATTTSYQLKLILRIQLKGEQKFVSFSVNTESFIKAH